MQLDLFGYEYLSDVEMQQIVRNIFAQYWTIRNMRGWRYGSAPKRKAYRIIEVEKKRLLRAGVSKREILDLLMCSRLRCKKGVQCPYCGGKRGQ